MKMILSIVTKFKSKLIILLLLVSLLMTSSTFAYWTNYVEGTSISESTSINIGTYKMYQPLFTLSNENEQGTFNIDLKYIFNNNGNTHYFNETFDAYWTTKLEQNEIAKGDIKFHYEVRILNNGTEISSKKFKNFIQYITVEFDESNATSMSANKEELPFGFSVSIEEPSKTNIYNQMKSLTVEIIISYTINNITYQYIVE